jgi:hypothetical protein
VNTSVEDVQARQVITDVNKRLRLIERWRRRDLKRWKKIRAIRKKRALDLLEEQRLKTLELLAEQRKDDDGANLAAFVTLAFFAMAAATVGTYFYNLGMSAKATYEFLSYALPALAALVAGLTAYLKDRAILWFWLSVVLVLSGVIAFLSINGVSAPLLWNWMIAYGAAAAAFLYPYVRVRGRQRGNRKKWLERVCGGISLLLAALVVCEVLFSHGYPTAHFTDLVQKLGAHDVTETVSDLNCSIVSRDKATSSMLLRCRTK